MIVDRLWFALALRRHGVLPWLGLALLLVAALLHWSIVPRAAAALAGERAVLAETQRALAAPAPTRVSAPVQVDTLKSRHDAFNALLVAPGDATRKIELLFEEAARGKFALARGEYKWGRDADGGFRTLEAGLPVKAPYPVVRRFADDILAAIPAAALLEAGLRREGVGTASLEARLRFVLYLQDGAP